VFHAAPTKREIENATDFCAPGTTDDARRQMKSAFLRTRTIPRKQYDSILRLLSIFAEHLGSISNRLLVTEEEPESAAMTKIRAFISSHQTDAICLIDVARAANMSACYFCRIFKRTTGLTFTDYLARERVESAKVMLLNAHTRISEAAYASGFQSLSQFNRVFRRVEGESPSHYRNHLGDMKRPSARTTSLIHAA
jgi:AraC-like DNA-binding protein